MFLLQCIFDTFKVTFGTSSQLGSFVRMPSSIMYIDKFTRTFLRAFSIRAAVISMTGRRLDLQAVISRLQLHNRVFVRILTETQQTARRSITHQNVEVDIVEAIFASSLALQHEIQDPSGTDQAPGAKLSPLMQDVDPVVIIIPIYDSRFEYVCDTIILL